MEMGILSGPKSDNRHFSVLLNVWVAMAPSELMRYGTSRAKRSVQQWQSSTAMRNGARGADRGEVQWHFLVMEMGTLSVVTFRSC